MLRALRLALLILATTAFLGGSIVLFVGTILFAFGVLHPGHVLGVGCAAVMVTVFLGRTLDQFLAGRD